MRYPAEETAAKHHRVLGVASAMIRERGIDDESVSEVMKAAGMTYGAFYSHFSSKDDLVSAAIREAMDQKRAMLLSALNEPATAKEIFVGHYLGNLHRDNCAESCPMAALAIEIGRRKNDQFMLSEYLAKLISLFTAGFR